jgi:hypothetical protein
MSYLTWSGFRDLADRLVGRRRQGGCLLYVVGGLLGRVLGGGAAEEVKKASAALGVLCLASGGVLHSDSLLVSPQLSSDSLLVSPQLSSDSLLVSPQLSWEKTCSSCADTALSELRRQSQAGYRLYPGCAGVLLEKVSVDPENRRNLMTLPILFFLSLKLFSPQFLPDVSPDVLDSILNLSVSHLSWNPSEIYSQSATRSRVEPCSSEMKGEELDSLSRFGFRPT